MRYAGFLSVTLLLSSCVTNADAVFEKQDIFPRVSLHTHGSSIVECPNGDLLACWFHGSGERKADDVRVQGARLKRGTAQWSPMFLMADTPGLADCNPVLFIDPQERLWLFYIPVLARRWECCQLKYRRAEDYTGEGPPNWSWQDVIVLKPGDAFADSLEKGFEELDFGEGMWAEYAFPYRRLLLEAARDPYKRQTGWMTRIHPVTLPSGRILLPLYSDGFNLSLVALSDDRGETWRASLPIVGLGPTQPSIVRRTDGTLVAYLRDTGEPPNRVQISRSDDEGESWSPAIDTDIPNPDSSLEVLTLKDGRWLMIHNDTEDGRHRLAASVSDDQGVTWNRKRLIEEAPEGTESFAYPSTIQSRDGLIHITYSHKRSNGSCIRHCVFSVDWLEGRNVP